MIFLNPNNEYEFCFTRMDTTKTARLNLYKYNFCTNKTTLLKKDVFDYIPDWSAKDWILFGQKDGLWKIKSNGDSLTQLSTKVSSSDRWLPSGTKCVSNAKIIDEKGVFVMNAPHIVTPNFTWESDSTILYSIKNSSSKNFDIYRYNIIHKISTIVYPMLDHDGVYINFFSPKDKSLYIVIIDQKKYRHEKINTETWQNTLINTYEGNYQPVPRAVLKDKYLVTLSLTDTLTGKPCLVNYRSHIALMNLDGTNEQQVIIPE